MNKHTPGIPHKTATQKAADLAASMLASRTLVDTAHGKAVLITAKQAKYLGDLLGQAGINSFRERSLSQFPWVDAPGLSFMLLIRKGGAGILVKG